MLCKSGCVMDIDWTVVCVAQMMKIFSVCLHVFSYIALRCVLTATIHLTALDGSVYRHFFHPVNTGIILTDTFLFTQLTCRMFRSNMYQVYNQLSPELNPLNALPVQYINHCSDINRATWQHLCLTQRTIGGDG